MRLLYPVSLVGLPGVGKTRTAEVLSLHLQTFFYDTDREIEQQTRQSVRDLFAREGEAFFRRTEAGILRKLLPGEQGTERKPFILATGGGLFTSSDNQIYLKAHSRVIWLKLSPEFLIRRLTQAREQRESRPLLKFTDWPERLKALAQSREEAYAKADWVYTVGEDETPEEVTVALKAYLREEKIAAE